jgi:nitrate reductase NapE
MASINESSDYEGRKGQELAVFLFLTICLAPILSVAIVGTYGFSIWMYQLIAGPPAF